MSFELEKGEFIVRHLRKSWFVFLTELLPHAILLVLPFALPKLFLLVPPFAPFAAYFTFSTPLSRLILGSYLLVVWTSAWGTFTRYYLNAWVLTSQRIINIKQPRFFTREVSSLFLSRVQDVTSDVSGFLESLLNIGDITVQSAGEEREFIMRGITRPEHLRDLILKYVPEEDEQKPAV
jgi:hypothetical protein